MCKDGSIWEIAATDFMIGTRGHQEPDVACYKVKPSCIGPYHSERPIYNPQVKSDFTESATSDSWEIDVPVGEIGTALVAAIASAATSGALSVTMGQAIKGMVM